MLLKRIFSVSILSVILSSSLFCSAAAAKDVIPFILLSQYTAAMDIGDSFYLTAMVYNGKRPTFKSEDSKIASVNSYGKVTAKKGGSTLITVKTSNAEAFCRITVRPTDIKLNMQTVSAEHGETIQLKATTSNGSAVKWKTNKKSVAAVDENGLVTAGKPGEAVITAAADGTSVTCQITIRKPVIVLNRTSAVLFRTGTVSLHAEVSSGIRPIWKSNRKSIATVDENGVVTAVKNGTAVISAVVDGVSQTCDITVQKPVVTLDSTSLLLQAGSTSVLTASVSSGIKPVWTSSNPSIAAVDANGKVTAIQKGTAYIYAAEDGVKARCTVKVTEP